MKKWAFLLLLIPLMAGAQLQLSEQAEIRIVTCGPYQGELYSAFGHSAIRVFDPQIGYDLIYNYGVFDFNQPNFYLNFARGHLNYKLAVSPYRLFRHFYESENRYMHEQVLNLTHRQQQRLFDFLQWNALPENQYYLYDYFYDNCATRVRDALVYTFGDSVHFDGSYIETEYSIRDLCDLYLQQQPWGDLGIDLCLGLPMDKTATPYEYMFLPDYVEKGFDHASIITEGEEVPLVKETIVTYAPYPEEIKDNLYTPFVIFLLIFFFGAWLSYRFYRKGKRHLWFDAIVFSLVGLIGWFLLALWLLTDHRAAASNFNLLWAIPFHFPIGLLLIFYLKKPFVKVYFRIMIVLYVLLLLAWPFLPQDLHYSLIPLVLLLLLRSVVLQQSAPSTPGSTSHRRWKT